MPEAGLPNLPISGATDQPFTPGVLAEYLSGLGFTFTSSGGPTGIGIPTWGETLLGQAISASEQASVAIDLLGLASQLPFTTREDLNTLLGPDLFGAGGQFAEFGFGGTAPNYPGALVALGRLGTLRAVAAGFEAGQAGRARAPYRSLQLGPYIPCSADDPAGRCLSRPVKAIARRLVRETARSL